MASLPVQIGQVIGHYRVIEQIGAGAMGVVYRAWDERLQRDVALKVLALGLAADASARKRFRNEALCLSRLNHPNIEQVFDFHSELGIDYLVMEYVSGMSLDERLLQGAFPEQQAINIGGQLARGLIAAHGQRIVHRDLKPGNLRLTPENLLKILDFGLAQLFLTPAQAADAETLTRLYGFGGTLPYMAPEQFLGGEPSVQSDLYSAGAVIYELLTARRLFSQHGSDFMSAKLNNKLPKPEIEEAGLTFTRPGDIEVPGNRPGPAISISDRSPWGSGATGGEGPFQFKVAPSRLVRCAPQADCVSDGLRSLGCFVNAVPLLSRCDLSTVCSPADCPRSQAHSCSSISNRRRALRRQGLVRRINRHRYQSLDAADRRTICGNRAGW